MGLAHKNHLTLPPMQWPHCSIYVSSGVCIEYNLLTNCIYLVTVCLLFCPFASLQKNLRCAAAAKWEVTKSHWPRCNATAIPRIWKFYIHVNVNFEIKKLWNIQALLPPPNKRQSANKSSSFSGQKCCFSSREITVTIIHHTSFSSTGYHQLR